MITPLEFLVITLAVVAFVLACLFIGMLLEKTWHKIKQLWWRVKRSIKLAYKLWKLNLSIKRTVKLLEQDDALEPETRKKMREIVSRIKEITEKNHQTQKDHG